MTFTDLFCKGASKLYSFIVTVISAVSIFTATKVISLCCHIMASINVDVMKTVLVQSKEAVVKGWEAGKR